MLTRKPVATGMLWCYKDLECWRIIGSTSPHTFSSVCFQLFCHLTTDAVIYPKFTLIWLPIKYFSKWNVNNFKVNIFKANLIIICIVSFKTSNMLRKVPQSPSAICLLQFMDLLWAVSLDNISHAELNTKRKMKKEN